MTMCDVVCVYFRWSKEKRIWQMKMEEDPDEILVKREDTKKRKKSAGFT